MLTHQETSQPARVYTVGHSTRPLDAFIALLRAYGISLLVDVRTVPRSRTNPQFNHDTLPAAVRTAGIAYEHVPELGGLRKPIPDSMNTAWRNLSFRGYADYMQTDTFAAAVDHLAERAQHDRIAIMCAKAVPWRCHRSLIGDALLARGISVYDILDATHAPPHKLTPWARVDGTRVTYPATDRDD
jgi:uncharacterized protein (DUF488 family)